MTYDRRTFLRRAGLLGVATVAGVQVPRPAAAADDTLGPFLHGVASGDPTASSVVLWTRVSGSAAPIDVGWRVATDVGMTDVVATGTTRAEPDRDHTVKVDVGGLAPASWYFYEFTALGRPSMIGRTKTAPVTSTHLRFGVASCANYTGGWFNAYARLAEREDLDAIIHVGDYLYEYGNGADRYGPGTGALQGARDHSPPHEMVSLADYRERHAHYKLDPDLRRLHQLLPFIVTWDDHESTNNSHRDGAENHQPDAEGDWEARKRASAQAYSEWMPIRAEDPSAIYRVLRYGDLADIVVLDTRIDDRDPEVGTTGATVVDGAAIDDPARRMIGDRQREMLYGALSTSTARWKVVAQQVIMGQWNAGGAPLLPGGADVPVIRIRDGGNALNPDQWDGYTAERANLFAHIRDEDIDDVVVLTGDVHTSWALDLTEDPYDPTRYVPLTGDGALAVEFVTPSISSANFESLGPEGVLAFETVTLADNPHVKYVDFDGHGYFVLDLTVEHAQADWFIVDTVLAPSDAEAHAASWRTATGENRLTAAAAPAAGGTAAPATPEANPRTEQPAPTGALPATGREVGAGTVTALLAAAGLSGVLARRARLGERPHDGS